MRLARTAAAALLLAVAVPACSRGGQESLPAPKPGFCEAAQRYDREVEKGADLDEQIRIVEKMERNAPKDVATDTTTFLTALRAVRDGDESVIDDPAIQEAVENVNRRAINGCEFFESEPGDGS